MTKQEILDTLDFGDWYEITDIELYSMFSEKGLVPQDLIDFGKPKIANDYGAFLLGLMS